MEPRRGDSLTPHTVSVVTENKPRPSYAENMSHTFAHNLVHCVFSTKDRMNLIKNPEELWRYTAGLAYAKDIHVVVAGGTANHLRLLILLPQTITLAKAMQELKANTSRWLRETSSAFSGRKDTVRSV
jgi:putative transposase